MALLINYLANEMQEMEAVALQKEVRKESLPKLFQSREVSNPIQLESEVLVRSFQWKPTRPQIVAEKSIRIRAERNLIDKEGGVKRRRSGKEPASTSAPSETTTKTAGQTTSAGTTTHTKSASQSAPVGDAMHSTDVFKGPADQEFETGVQDEQAKKEAIWHNRTLEESFDELTDSTCGLSALRPTFTDYRIQDIEDMLLLLVQGKVTNLNVEERIAFNVSLRMFTRRVVIQRRVEDLQLGVESYQKKLNLTKPDTLMRLDELHKFSDGTLDDVRTALNDRLKGIRMEYLPETFWNQRDKANARAMIQAIERRPKRQGG
ncbi:hypothetical protein Tco_0915735 [Tanacetum coccineum]